LGPEYGFSDKRKPVKNETKKKLLILLRKLTFIPYFRRQFKSAGNLQ